MIPSAYFPHERASGEYAVTTIFIVFTGRIGRPSKNRVPFGQSSGASALFAGAAAGASFTTGSFRGSTITSGRGSTSPFTIGMCAIVAKSTLSTEASGAGVTFPYRASFTKIAEVAVSASTPAPAKARSKRLAITWG